MARISTYSLDTDVVASDKWIGSDFQNSNQTKNFTPISLANFLNHNQVIDYANSLRYFYQTLEPGETRKIGSISFPTEIGVSIPFSSLNNFLLSNRTLKQNDVTEYLDFLIGSKITISNSSNTNLFGFYEVLDISTYIPDPNFLNVSLDYITGNGEMLEDIDYLISLVDKASGDAIPTLTSELINDGEDGINPFISLAELPYQIEIYVDVASFPPVGQDELIYFAEYPGLFYLWNGETSSYDQITSNAFPTGLERLTEGSNTGWRLIGRNRTYYGPIGSGAVDLSYSNTASEVLGATGSNSFATGDKVIASGNNSSAIAGYFAKARSFCEFVIGAYNTDYTPTSTTDVSPTDRSFVIGAGTIGNAKDVLTVYKNGAVKFYVEALSGITNGAAGFFIFNSTDNNRPYIHNGTDWKALAYTDDSVIPTLQEILDNNHDLVDNKNYQGTGAGVGNTGLSVNALGANAGNLNTGSFANLLGTNSGKQNSGANLNAFGKDAGQSNTGTSVNAFGISAAYLNTGTNVNGLGNKAGVSNTGTNLNALGFLAGLSNSATNVNALGVQAGASNTFKNVNLFGYFAAADAENQNVFSKWVSGTTKYLARLSFNNITADRKWELQDSSGIIAHLSDIPSVAGYVPYTGATQDVNLGEFGVQLGNLKFDLTPTNVPTAVGSMVWNDTAGTLDLKLKGGNVTLQIGQETVARVVNKTATNITLLESNYQIVRVTGAQGQRPKVDLALANNDLNSTTTLGLVTENILNNQEGFITTSGQVQEINTTGSLQGETWADGDVLYLSGTVAGQATNIKPIAPIHTVIIGFVEYAHITQGKIFVKVDNGYELEELHNVSAITPNNNEVLTYDTATLLWKPKTVSSALGYTPEDIANKENTLLDNSTTKYPTNNLVKTTVDLKVNSSTATTGSVISFDVNKIYNTFSTPTTADITNDLTNAKIGVVQKIYSNKAVAPTYPLGWVKIGGDYTTSVVNIIYAEWSEGSRVEYWIIKG